MFDDYEIFGYYDFTAPVDVSDPCYNKDVWCRLNDVKLTPGEYAGYIRLCDWNTRVGELFILNSQYTLDDLRSGNVTETDELGEIGVDAGMAGIFQNKPDFGDKEWSDFVDKILEETEPLHTVCDWGFVTSSGWGDGGYPVFAWTNQDDEIVGISIEYIPTDEY